MVIIFHNITVYTVFFDQINAALVSRRDFFQKHIFVSYKAQTMYGIWRQVTRTNWLWVFA